MTLERCSYLPSTSTTSRQCALLAFAADVVRLTLVSAGYAWLPSPHISAETFALTARPELRKGLDSDLLVKQELKELRLLQEVCKVI